MDYVTPQSLKLAGCVIQDKTGRILLLHRNTAKRTHWEMPGGKLEPDEVPEAAAIREIKEELGVEVVIRKLIGEKSFHEDDLEMTYTWFLAEITSGEPAIMESHIFDDLRYFSYQQLQTMKDQLSSNMLSYLLYSTEKG